jgi:hypothetical protein
MISKIKALYTLRLIPVVADNLFAALSANEATKKDIMNGIALASPYFKNKYITAPYAK